MWLYVDLIVRMEARRNDPTMNLEELAREKLAFQTERDKLMQENTKRRDVSITFVSEVISSQTELSIMDLRSFEIRIRIGQFRFLSKMTG